MRANILHVALFLGAASAWPWSWHGKHEQPAERAITYKVNQDRADAVKEAFLFAWDGYTKYAFPNDDLLPVNNSFSNPRLV
jgi:mannosyl-oligosaccharide alpha-1,2-mannosidase